MPTQNSEQRRRRSSHLLQPTTTVKPGIYGLQARPIAFAPNVTPGTFVEPDSLASVIPPSGAVLFPPSEKTTQQPVRKRHPPGKRPSQGYIPRPPNAFMLFRADFVKQRHVPGSIETNHGSLSKIIGNCWRQLPLEEKRYWEQRAKEEKQQHKIRHPDYRFRPVHNKNKTKDGIKGSSNLTSSKKEKPQQTPEEEMRCDAVAALLLEGKKGDELAQAVRSMDKAWFGSREGTVSARGSFSSMTPPIPSYYSNNSNNPGQAMSGLRLRRPSSVPLPETWPNDYPSNMFAGYPVQSIALPQVPFMTSSRAVSPSPITNISFAAQQQHGHLIRRPSSAQPTGLGLRRSWTTPVYEGYSVMPFLQDLGIENQFGHFQPHHPQQMEAETAGEPDYTLFSSGFSFNNSQPTNVPSVATSQDGTNIGNLGPHDFPPILNLSTDHMNWNGEVDPALDSATSLVSSSSTAISSLESSPAPSDTLRDMYGPTAISVSQNGGYAPSAQMYSVDTSYDLGLSTFDMSPLDHLSISNAHYSHDHHSPYSFDHAVAGMQGLMESSPQTMNPTILHAPKPLLPNDCTPTNTVFGEKLDDYNIR